MRATKPNSLTNQPSRIAAKVANWVAFASDSAKKHAACWPFPKPPSGSIAVKVINRFGDEVKKVIKVG